MRWEITSSSEIEDNKKITTKKKVQYITVGDIVAMGKSAAGAVLKLAKKVPRFIAALKENGADTMTQAGAMALNNIVQPLAVMVQGLDIYKKVMTVLDMVNPIMKMISRATGVWCSPGNAGDMAQIILGTVQQILIGIAISAVIALKEWVWAFEFKFREISESSSIAICNKLKKKFKKRKGKKILSLGDEEDGYSRINPNLQDDYSEDKASKLFADRRAATKNKIDNMFKEEQKAAAADVQVLLNSIYGPELTPEEKCSSGKSSRNNYITEKVVENDILRMLSGSLENHGIFYSDDKGKTWLPTKQKDVSFAKFAKIYNKEEDKWIYIAGSTHYIKSLKKIQDDKEFVKNEIGHYNKDYYEMDGNDNINKVSKIQKDRLEEKYPNFEAIKNMDIIKEYGDRKSASGIFYSDDDGMTWQKSNIDTGSFELFFEYREKDGTPARVVAASSDYEGIYYTEDGKEWQRSNLLNNGKENPIDTERWVVLKDSYGTIVKLYGDDMYVNNTSDGKVVTRVVKAGVNKEFNIKSNNYFVSGNGLEDAAIMAPKIIPITTYIHEHYTDRLINYTAQWWNDLINKIKHDKYTLEDAKAGKDL